MARSNTKRNTTHAVENAGLNHANVWGFLDEILPDHPRTEAACGRFLESVPSRAAAALEADWSAILLIDAGELRPAYLFPGDQQPREALQPSATMELLARFPSPGCRTVAPGGGSYRAIASLMGAEPSGPVLVAPLIRRGEVLGLFCAARRGDQPFDGEYVRLADFMADMVSFSLGKELSAHAARGEAAPGSPSPAGNGHPGLLFRLDRDGRVQYADLIGGEGPRLPEAMPGQTISEFMDPIEADGLLRAVGRVLDTSRPEALELTLNLGARPARYAVSLWPLDQGLALAAAMALTDRPGQACPPASGLEGGFRAVLESTGTAVMIIDGDMTIVRVNSDFEKLVGLPRESVEGRMSWMDFCHPDDRERISAYHRARLSKASPAPRNYEARLVIPGGDVRQVVVTAGLIPGTGLGMISMLDVSELREALFQRDLQKAYFEQLFERIPLAIVLVDPQDRVMAINAAFEKLFGYDRDEAAGRSINSLIVPPDLAEEATGISRQTQEGQLIFAESKRRTADGRILDVSIIGTPVYVSDRQEAVFGIYQDITEQKRTRQQLVYQANHDHLTGLSNRRKLLTRIGDAIRRSRRTGLYDFAVLFVDLNRFKVVNDSLGHLFGDAMLIIIARMLQDSLGDNGVVARLGGDDFGVLVEHPQVTDFVSAFVRRVQERLRTPFQVMGRQVTTSASVGVVFGRQEYVRAEDYLRDASLAMQRAKTESNENCQVFDGRMHDHAMRRMLLESSLRMALDNDEFVLHYQPIVELVSGRKRGYEALVRWKRKDEGIVPPEEFIPLAEETGLIVPIGYWVLERACADFARLSAHEDGDLSLSVNISGKQFRDPDIYSRIKSILRRTDMPAERLRLEITESMLMHDPENVSRILSRLKNLGIKISVDDFGTGYSSLSYLSRFPIDVLKIDKAFVAPLQESSPTSVRLVQTIISLGNSLGLEVVAEGVESSEHVDRLTSLGCSLGQGYLFAKPASLADSTDK